MIFFVGLHQPADARHFDTCMVSLNRLAGRVSDFAVSSWIADSGAFTKVARDGGYRTPVSAHGAQLRRWRRCGRLLAGVQEDLMCEPFVLARTGLSVSDHQRLTIERYDQLVAYDPGVYVMPVLQGYAPHEYAAHARAFGARLAPGAWVGVGSVCKRNSRPAAVEAVLLAVTAERPDLRLHGFGLKQTALASGIVRGLLHSADSMAWSFAARREGRNANNWREARAYAERVDRQEWQADLFAEAAHA